MRRSEAEDAGGLTPVKDDNDAVPHFTRRTLLFFNCFDYKPPPRQGQKAGGPGRGPPVAL